MRIDKVEKRPMDIHTKKEMQIHVQKGGEESGRSTGGVSPTGEKRGLRKKHTQVAMENKSKHRIIHSSNMLLKNAEMEGAKTAAQQIDGGEEMHQASILTCEAFRPVASVVSHGVDLLKESVLEQKRKKYKIVTPVSEEAVGTDTVIAVAGAGGVRIGQAAGKMTGNVIDQKAMKQTMKQTMKRRKIQFFLDKMKAENKQTDSAVKMVRDVLLGKSKLYVGKVSLAIMGILGGFISMIAMVAVPVVLVVAILYNSPFAIFLPQLDADETVQTVTSAYVSDFLTEVETLAEDHTGYDEGELYYWDTDGNVITPSPHQDIICVYMVEYGVGDTAVVMNDKSKEKLKSVVEDMCTYSTSDRTEKRKNIKGKEYEVDILEVNVVIKDYRDMVSEYRFSQEQIKMIEEMMKY